MLVCKVKIPNYIVDEYLDGNTLLDLDRMVVYYSVYKTDIFDDVMIKWIEKSNLMNMLVYRNRNNLLPNPHKYSVRYKKREDNVHDF